MFFLVKLYSLSSIYYILQSHCILPVLSIYLCAMDAGMCNITRRKRSWRTVIEVHRWASTMQSIAPHPLAATLMKLCVMIRLCYLELLGILNSVWVGILLEINLWIGSSNAWMWCRMWNCMIIGRASLNINKQKFSYRYNGRFLHCVCYKI